MVWEWEIPASGRPKLGDGDGEGVSPEQATEHKTDGECQRAAVHRNPPVARFDHAPRRRWCPSRTRG